MVRGGRRGLGIIGAALLLVGAAWGQGEKKPPAPPLVSVDARDADVRQTLVDLFKRARVANYTIDSAVQGRITIVLKDKPFEEALTLVTRAAAPPLVWSKTDNFYQVRPRPIRRVAEAETVLPGIPDPAPVRVGPRCEVIPLMYADARDIAAALGAVRPPDLTGAYAYVPNNNVLTRWGGANGFARGVIGGLPGGEAPR